MPVPESASVSRSASSESARVDTADCFEIEDIDDTGWEFVNRPADPLPNGNQYQELSLFKNFTVGSLIYVFEQLSWGRDKNKLPQR